MSLPTACSVRQAQLTSLWVSTVFHKWQCAKIPRGNEGSRANKKTALLSVYSGCISVFVEGHIGYCVFICCAQIQNQLWREKKMSNVAKIFFHFLAKHLGPSYFIILYQKLQATKQGRGGGWLKIELYRGLNWERGGEKNPMLSRFFKQMLLVPLSAWEKAINVHSLWEGNHGKRLDIWEI